MALVLQGADLTRIIGNRKLIFHTPWAKEISIGEENRTDTGAASIISLSHVELRQSYKLSGYQLSTLKTEILILV